MQPATISSSSSSRKIDLSGCRAVARGVATGSWDGEGCSSPLDEEAELDDAYEMVMRRRARGVFVARAGLAGRDAGLLVAGLLVAGLLVSGPGRELQCEQLALASSKQAWRETHPNPSFAILAAKSPSSSLESLSPYTALDVLRPARARLVALPAAPGVAVFGAFAVANKRSTSESEMISGEISRIKTACGAGMGATPIGKALLVGKTQAGSG